MSKNDLLFRILNPHISHHVLLTPSLSASTFSSWHQVCTNSLLHRSNSLPPDGTPSHRPSSHLLPCQSHSPFLNPTSSYSSFMTYLHQSRTEICASLQQMRWAPLNICHSCSLWPVAFHLPTHALCLFGHCSLLGLCVVQTGSAKQSTSARSNP